MVTKLELSSHKISSVTAAPQTGAASYINLSNIQLELQICRLAAGMHRDQQL